jgi:hypothetical protein
VTTQLWSISIVYQREDAIEFLSLHETIVLSSKSGVKTSGINDVSSLVGILSQYRDEHGSHVLQTEVESPSQERFHNRKFLTVYYTCPHAAGNMLHDFYNQVLAGIVLNRTILLKYNDLETCSNNTLKNTHGVRCRKANTQADCERSLRRKALWLPMYDDWISSIELNHNEILPLRDSEANSLDSWKHNRLVALRSAQYYISQGKGSIWKDQIFQPTHTPQAQKILQQLYSHGADLLYGVLFNELLEFQPTIAPPELELFQSLETNLTKSFVLHSRHFINADTGDNVRKEIQCLQKLLPSPQYDDKSTTKCVVFLMSDREQSIDLLKAYLQETFPHCVPIVATHSAVATTNTESSGHYFEHGKWAGMGFMQDLMVGSNAKDGFIGHCHRSSSQLLREMVEYNRHKSTTGNKIPELATCCLPSVIGHDKIQSFKSNRH